MRTFAILQLAILLFSLHHAAAQDSTVTSTQEEEVNKLSGSVDGINETLTDIKNTVDALKKIKFSGYLQTQFQTAESTGISSFAGGNFPTNVRSRFQVRRGRLKLNYDNDLTQYVLQIDVTQNGVGIKDAYASVKEPWLRAISFTAGVFDRPFGFEISYSSGSRESPERSRLFQTLFPGERELGAKIEVMPEEGPLRFLNLKAGLFNGVLNNANENDRNKDFIGRIGFQVPFEEEGLAIDGGFSVYDGKVANTSKFVYQNQPGGAAQQFRVDSTLSNVGAGVGRSYLGGDIELYYDVPALGGLSLRGEYISGQQPGTAGSNSFYNPATADAPLYLRNFRGWYVTWIQNVGLRHQIIVKYDEFDPNTDVEANDIGVSGSGLTAADVKFSTLGLGWIYHWDTNVKFVFYYDLVTNESISAAASGNLAPYMGDLHDNVFTCRMQFKF